MVTVAHLLDNKPKVLHALTPEASVQQALEAMREHKVRSIVVLQDGRLVGIVSERDCALKVLLPGLSPGATRLDAVMTRDVVTVTLADTLDRVMVEMMNRSIRHLPVVDGTRVVGLVSVGDVVKEVMRQQEQHIRYLETYIKGHSGAY